MSDQIYQQSTPDASPNYVTVAQAASPSLVLTKRNFSSASGIAQKSYDNVKFYNFFEEELWNLNDLYSLSLTMLNKPRCCFLRARIKDKANCKHVVRKYKDDDATLVIQEQNWFALDVDWDKESEGDLLSDVNTVLLALGGEFCKADCFALASASYLFKPGIRMRLFYWASEPCSNQDLKRFLTGNKAGVDLALFNPIQPIYTAKPIGIDNVKQRIVWCPGSSPSINVPVNMSSHGDEEKRYTKEQAKRFLSSVLEKVGLIPSGSRHNQLFGYSIFLGKLIGQGLLDEEQTVSEVLNSCDNHWSGKRDVDKDVKTIRDAIDRGKRAVGGES